MHVPLYVSFMIICAVESSNGVDMFNKKDPLCVGRTQMRPIAVRDVNRICKLRNDKRRFNLADRMNKDKCWQMFEILVPYYLGANADMHGIAKMWCRGVKKMSEDTGPTVEEYIAKVDAELRKRGLK